MAKVKGTFWFKVNFDGPMGGEEYLDMIRETIAKLPGFLDSDDDTEIDEDEPSEGLQN